MPKGIHTYKCNWSGFEALEAEKNIRNSNYDQILFTKDLHLVKDSIKIENAVSSDNSLKAFFYFIGETNWEAEKIFFDLSLPDFLNENPFKNEERFLPVDFGHTSTHHFNYSILLPENYNVSELPENIMLKVPDGSATFIYQSTQIENQLQVIIKFDIRKSFVHQQSYLHLRELYSKMINHCQQPYVFAKVK